MPASLGKGAQSVSWKAVNADGPTASPASGTMSVKPGKDGSQAVTVTAPSAEGRYTLTFTMVGAGGVSLPDVVVEIDVAKPGSLWPFYSNAGISADGQSDQGNFDGDGWSYSPSRRSAAAGITPGTTVTVDGLAYALADTKPGDDDNIVAGGQTIPLATPVAATQLGILGSATNADGGSQGAFTVHFSDGTSQTVTLGVLGLDALRRGEPAAVRQHDRGADGLPRHHRRRQAGDRHVPVRGHRVRSAAGSRSRA